MRYKSCSRCGRVHPKGYKCQVNKKDYSRWKTDKDRLRSTSSWRKKSLEIREEANYLCEVCRDQGEYNYKGLEVHHIIKLRDDPDKLLDDDNLICLCKGHHEQADRGELEVSYLKRLAEGRNTNSVVTTINYTR